MVASTSNTLLEKLVRVLLDNPSSAKNSNLTDFGCSIEASATENEPILVAFSFPKESGGHALSTQEKQNLVVSQLRQKLPCRVKISAEGHGTLKFVIPRNDHHPEHPALIATLVAQLRARTLGAPIMKACKMLLTSSENSSSNKLSMPLGIHITGGRTENGYSHLIGTPREKVMVIVRVDSHSKDDVEHAISRLYLQQFAAVKAPTHHCEYRRGNDAPKELAWIQSPPAEDTCAGYLIFSFFPSHVHQLCGRPRRDTRLFPVEDRKLEDVVYRLVNFMVYLEEHVKEAKSYLDIRMREKKSFLLKPLVVKAATSTARRRLLTPVRSPRFRKRGNTAARAGYPTPPCQSCQQDLR